MDFLHKPGHSEPSLHASSLAGQGRSLLGFIIPTAGTGDLFRVREREGEGETLRVWEGECMWRPWLSWLGKREKGWNRFVPRLVALHAMPLHTHTHAKTALGMWYCLLSSGSLWESAPSHSIGHNQHQECKHLPDLPDLPDLLLLTEGILQVI